MKEPLKTRKITLSSGEKWTITELESFSNPMGRIKTLEKELKFNKRKLLLDFATFVNQNELSEADDKITDYSIKAFLKK